MHLLLEPFLRLFASLVSHGGQPHPDRNQFGPVLIYPLRPGVSAFFLGCLAFTVFALATDVPAFLHHQPIHPLRLSLALVLGALASAMLARTVSLDLPTFLNTNAAALATAQANNYARWPTLGQKVWPNAEAAGTYQGEVDYLNTWMAQRFTYMDSLYLNQ